MARTPNPTDEERRQELIQKRVELKQHEAKEAVILESGTAKDYHAWLQEHYVLQTEVDGLEIYLGVSISLLDVPNIFDSDSDHKCELCGCAAWLYGMNSVNCANCGASQRSPQSNR